MVQTEATGDAMTEKSPDLTGFAIEMADTLFDADGGDIDYLSLECALVEHGVIEFRAARPAEVADPEWWGQEFYDKKQPDKKFVGQLTAAMVLALKQRSQVDRSDEPKSTDSE
jgi:hypothetical protein